jgi:hypothetical protein
MKQLKLTCLSAAMMLAMPAWAESAATPEVSAQDVLNILIQQGVVDEKRVNDVVRKAKDKTRSQYNSAVEAVPRSQADVKPAQEGSVVRVPYVPQYIQDDIRDKVRNDLREQVVDDVMNKAKQERWGVPGTAPDWTQRIKFSGDARVRAESIMFPSDNVVQGYKDYNYINSKKVEGSPNDYLNTSEDRNRMRTRFRLGMKANVTQGVEAGARVVTGSTSNPVSTNETLGDYGNSFGIVMDRAYIKYKTHEERWSYVGGRFENPFMRTDLIWDNDLQFDGVAASWYWLRTGAWDDADRQWDPFVTFGIFPVDEFELSDKDKWLFGFQTGFTYSWWSQDELSFAVGYYHYENTVGIRNPVGLEIYNYTAPDFFQKGNSVFNIMNPDPGDPNAATKALYALAYDYHIVDVLLEYRLAVFSPHQVVLTAEYIKNIGADDAEAESLRRSAPVETRHDGMLLKATFGWPIVAKPNDWQVSVGYRALRADAVIDGFADSDFHMGGTDGKGYVFEAQYGLLNETWLTLKWMSSDSIDLASPSTDPTTKSTLGVDILQIDVNARF